MGGLTPNSNYTVFVSKSYAPYHQVGWNVAGITQVHLDYLGIDYPHGTNFIQSGNTITGGLTHPDYPKIITNGTISGNTISIEAAYIGYTGSVILTGTIAPDGTISGTWVDTWEGRNINGTFTMSGAVPVYTGDTTWPGLLSDSLQPFNFVTDELGKAIWTTQITSAITTLPVTFSVWINSSGGTMLISNNASLGE